MRKPGSIRRRDFLRNTSLGVLGMGIAGRSSAQQTPQPGGGTPPPKTAKIQAYRTLGQTGFKASDIALGGIENVQMIKAMLDAGVNYIDTAEGYNAGKAEISVGEAIKGRDRKSLFITTKLQVKENESKESILDRARKCLERLGTEYIDCLMIHNPPNTEMVKYEPFHEVCRSLINEGKLRFVGISSHGAAAHSRGEDSKQEPMDKVLSAAVQDGRFAVMLFVYNFIQREMGEKVLALCRGKKIGVTLMKTNPVGNYLARKSEIESRIKQEKDPERLKRMQDYLQNAQKTAEEADWFIKKYNLANPLEIRLAATRFVLSQPAVTAVLARIVTFEDIDQFMQASGTTLTDTEAAKLSAFAAGPGKLYCRHACGLCESNCPRGVPVNTIMRYNHYFEAHGLEKLAMLKYSALPTTKADRCENCAGMCQERCPYGVPIHGMLNIAHENLRLA